MMLLAQTTVDAIAANSMVGDLVVAVVGSAVGAAIGVLSSVFLLSRQEWFRKLSSWEPYHQSLWNERLTRLLSLHKRLNDLENDCLDCIISGRGEGKPSISNQQFNEKMEEIMALIKATSENTLVLNKFVSESIFDALGIFGEILEAARAEPDAQPPDNVWDKFEKELSAKSANVINEMASLLRISTIESASIKRFNDLAKQLKEK